MLEVTTLADYLAGGPHRRAARRGRASCARGRGPNVLMGVASNRVDVKQRRGARRAGPRAAGRAAVRAVPGARGSGPARCWTWPGARWCATPPTTRSCACSVDEVVDAVLVRYAEAYRIADGLADQALGALTRSLAEAGPHRGQRRRPGARGGRGGGRRGRRGGARRRPGAARGARRLRHPPGPGPAHPRRHHGADHPRHAAQRQPDRHPHLDPGRRTSRRTSPGSTSPSPSGARSASTSPSRRSSRTSTPASGPGPTPWCASGSTSRRCGACWPGWPTSRASAGRPLEPVAPAHPVTVEEPATGERARCVMTNGLVTVAVDRDDGHLRPRRRGRLRPAGRRRRPRRLLQLLAPGRRPHRRHPRPRVGHGDRARAGARPWPR